MAYHPLRPGSPIFAAYRDVSAWSYTVYGHRFDDRTRREATAQQIGENFGRSPDRTVRTALLQMVALMGTLTGVPVVAVFSCILWPLHAYIPLGVLYILFSICTAWSVVCIFRLFMDDWDKKRWVKAGRPEGWLPWGLAQPKDRDLVYMAVVAALVAWPFLNLLP